MISEEKTRNDTDFHFTTLIFFLHVFLKKDYLLVLFELIGNGQWTQETIDTAH